MLAAELGNIIFHLSSNGLCTVISVQNIIHWRITPYLCRLLEEKDNYTEGQIVRLQGGLRKLAEASVQLEELNAKLAVQRVAVAEKTKACETLLAEIASSSQLATEKKELAVTKGKEIEIQSKEIEVEKVRECFCVGNSNV